MALFGKKPKGIDTQALQNILNQGATRQTDIINRAFTEAPQITSNFAQTQNQLAEAFESDANRRAQEFGQQLQGVESPDLTRQRIAKSAELAFRNLPAVQQNIREQLAATGGLGRGAAIRALARPTLEASRSASDEAFRIQSAADQRNVERREKALDTIFSTGQAAALTRLGIDRNTARVLLETGRGDILDKAFKLAGIEAGRTQGLLDIEKLRQTQEAAKEAASQARLGQVLSGVGSLAGTGIGFLAGGGPIGALAGSQIGGQVGGFAGGGGAPDLSGILALLAAQQKKEPTTVTT